MKVGIFSNLTRDLCGVAAQNLFNYLSKCNNVEIFLWDDLKNTITVNYQLSTVNFLNKEELAKKSDIIFVFGGDGTILRIAKLCAQHNAKIFAVNLGNLGYLTETEKGEDISKSVNEIIKGNYFLDTRYLLEASFNTSTFLALNEAVVERGHKTKMLKTEVRVNGASAGSFNSDGIIVSTPTGSTAYSLSAGGPIVSPDVNALIVVPICPHSLHSRPLVVGDKKIITVTALGDENASLDVDGEQVATIPNGGSVTIKASNLKVDFIRLNDYNYYEKLKEKLVAN